MLDVHPPHGATHTWRDFFIHIATICVGLLIALGLEQSVEAIHHHRELSTLREHLQADSRKAEEDARQTEQSLIMVRRWALERLRQVDIALAQNQPVPPAPDLNLQDFDLATNPTWSAAKTTGALAVMPEEEVKAYSEIDDGTRYDFSLYIESVQALQKVADFQKELSAPGKAAGDMSLASRADLLEYQRALRAEYASAGIAQISATSLRRANAAILHGAKTLEEVQRAEKQAD